MAQSSHHVSALALSERFCFHPVVVARIRRVDAPKLRVEQHHCSRAFRRAALLAYAPRYQLFLSKDGAVFIIAVCLTASTRALLKNVAVLRSQAPKLSNRAFASRRIGGHGCLVRTECVSDAMYLLRWILAQSAQWLARFLS